MIDELENDARQSMHLTNQRPVTVPKHLEALLAAQLSPSDSNSAINTSFALESETAPASPALVELVVDLGTPRVSVHVFEPIRNLHNEIVDFRLTFNEVAVRHPYQDFAGVKVVEIGPSVAPGETFHALRRVLETGETVRSTTRHVNGREVHLFQQVAERIGDAVMTTTTIMRQGANSAPG